MACGGLNLQAAGHLCYDAEIAQINRPWGGKICGEVNGVGACVPIVAAGGWPLLARMALVAPLALIVAVCCGCVERTLIILTSPPDVQVFVDGEPVGVTSERFSPDPDAPASAKPERELGMLRVPFDHYAVREITLSRVGFDSQTHYVDPQPPLWEHFPFDVFTEVVLPVTIEVEYSYRFTLEERPPHSYDRTYEAARAFRAKSAGALNYDETRYAGELAPYENIPRDNLPAPANQ